MATKRTYQPKKLHGQKVHGFRKRMSTKKIVNIASEGWMMNNLPPLISICRQSEPCALCRVPKRKDNIQ